MPRARQRAKRRKSDPGLHPPPSFAALHPPARVPGGREAAGFPLPPWPAGCAPRSRKQSGAEWERCGGDSPQRTRSRRRLPPSSASRLNCGVRIDWECKWQLKCNLHSQQELGGGEGTEMGSTGQEGGEGEGPRMWQGETRIHPGGPQGCTSGEHWSSSLMGRAS